MDHLSHYYQVLGLTAGASLAEVNQAYRDLAFVWHPDRMPPDNQRLYQKALAKLQEINQARDYLRRHVTVSPPAPHCPTPPPTPGPSRPHHPDLSGCNFHGANLRERDLSGRVMKGADLSYADLSDAFLHRVDLEGANLFHAKLFRANLLQANLRGADLREADLIGADLSGADLCGADLRGALVKIGTRVMVKLTGAVLAGAQLPEDLSGGAR